MFGELRLVRALTDEQIAAMRNPALAANTKLPTIEDAVAAGGFLAGRPEDIVEQLKAVEKRYPGLDRVICATSLSTRTVAFICRMRPLRGVDHRLPWDGAFRTTIVIIRKIDRPR